MATSQPPSADRHVIDLGLPIRTDRLVLRAGRLDDVETLHARRNEPVNKVFQSWAFPYPRAEAAELLEGLTKMKGPTFGQWWMVMVELAQGDNGSADSSAANTIGDVAVHLDETGTMAEIGYNIAPPHWGQGYATEAASTVIDQLFTRIPNLIRLEARLHPDNLASAVVAERCGLVFEGQTRSSFVYQPVTPGEVPEMSDGRYYSVLRSEWLEWGGRPTGPPADVSFVEITSDNVRSVIELDVHKSQEWLVAPVVHSLAHALVPRNRDNGEMIRPWYRAVQADGALVGFVMLAAPTEAYPDTYLWRMLVERRHQRRGIGRRVTDLVVSQARDWGSERLIVSWVPGPGSPEPFYLRYGFEATGPADQHGEIPGVLLI